MLLSIKEFAAIFSVVYVTTSYGIGGTKCIGPSMLPTFREDGDIVLYNCFNLKVLKRNLHC